MDILGPLLKTSNCKLFSLLMTYRFPKFARDVPVSRMTDAHITLMLMPHWIILYEIPDYVPTDNGAQFFTTFLEPFCAILETGYLVTTAYYTQTNEKVERFNKTILPRLRYYVAEHQQDWDIYVQSLTYAYSSQGHRSTNLPSFSLVLSQQPLGLQHSIIQLRCRLTLQQLLNISASTVVTLIVQHATGRVQRNENGAAPLYRRLR